MTVDPSGGSARVRNPGSWNRYTYAGGDPANRNDSSGLDPNCGPNMVWDGEGCTKGAGSLPTASGSPSVNIFAISSSQGNAVSTGSSIVNGLSPDILEAYNAYASNQQAMFLANYLAWYYDPTRQQNQLNTQIQTIMSGIQSLLSANGVPASQIALLMNILSVGDITGGHLNLTISFDQLASAVGAVEANYLTTGWPNDGNRAGGFWDLINSLHSELDPDNSNMVIFHVDTFNAGAVVPIGFFGHVAYDVGWGTFKQAGTQNPPACIDPSCP